MEFIARVAIIALALLVATYLIPGISVDSWVSLLVASVALGIANAILRPILVFVTLPLSIITFGLFLLVVNGFLVSLVARYVEGFHVADFLSAILGSIIVSIVSGLANSRD